MDWKPYCDAIVSFPDALRWVELLMKAKPDDVITQALAVELAVLGVGVDLARRTCERLEKYGVSEEHRAYIFNQVTLSGAMSIELMRRGNAKLWSDLIEPGDEEQKGVDHE
jgi:hypothetical protein